MSKRKPTDLYPMTYPRGQKKPRRASKTQQAPLGSVKVNTHHSSLKTTLGQIAHRLHDIWIILKILGEIFCGVKRKK